MVGMRTSAVLCVFALGHACSALAQDPAAFRIDAPDVALRGVPVAEVRIEALDEHGDVFTGYDGSPTLAGLRLTENGADVEVGAFAAGVLEISSDLSVGRKVYLTDSVVRVGTSERPVRLLPWWTSLLPPLVAIGLAILLRNVIVALGLGIWCGAALLVDGSHSFLARIGIGFVDSVQTTLVEQIGDSDHLRVILFTLFLGCMVGVMSGSGGTAALVHRLAGVAGSRRRVQMTTWGLGLLVFFDDYANCLLVGTTMHPVTDRLKISREKLAYLVDSTAAPVAGLAIVSTWIGIEVGLIGDTCERLTQAYGGARFETDAYAIFLATLPYRFYPVLLMFFVPLLAWTGQDFGPMLRAERRAAESTLPAGPVTVDNAQQQAPGNLWNAVVPLAVLIGALAIGFWWTGSAAVAAENAARAPGAPAEPLTLGSVIGAADSYQVLLISAFLASVSAVVSAVATYALKLHDAVEAWLEGLRRMLLGVLILALAWCIASVCDPDHLNTAGALIELTAGSVSVQWLPAIGFTLSAAVAFATGTSWTTMSLLIPLTMSLTFGLLAEENGFLVDGVVQTSHTVFLASIGAVLAGSILGDHCSPISDTTVLSSTACGCDHLSHVTTQIPYALVVGAVSLVAGYIPAGFGVSGYLLVPIGFAALWTVSRVWGRAVSV